MYRDSKDISREKKAKPYLLLLIESKILQQKHLFWSNNYVIQLMLINFSLHFSVFFLQKNLISSCKLSQQTLLKKFSFIAFTSSDNMSNFSQHTYHSISLQISPPFIQIWPKSKGGDICRTFFQDFLENYKISNAKNSVLDMKL